ncbi:MAG TPA: hypothetical protein VNU27_08680 [Candidatus Acidoferrum sp.]|nr:hypothetical protein [Candidatus Acidoferrum sp.]
MRWSILGRVLATFDANVLKQVATEIRNIKAEYRGVVSEDSIDVVARQSLQNLAGSRVPQFVPLFVGRFTRKRLHELTGFRPRVTPVVQTTLAVR